MSEPLSLAALFLIMIVQVIIPPIPAELIVISAGRLHGSLPTTLVAGAGLFCGSVIVYSIGRFIHQRLAKYFDREKTKRIIERIKAYETMILWLRILPYNPSDIISYAAGIVMVRPAKFLLITGVTAFARTWMLASLGTYITNMRSLLQVGSILLLSAVVGTIIAYGRKRTGPKDS